MATTRKKGEPQPPSVLEAGKVHVLMPCGPCRGTGRVEVADANGYTVPCMSCYGSPVPGMRQELVPLKQIASELAEAWAAQARVTGTGGK